MITLSEAKAAVVIDALAELIHQSDHQLNVLGQIANSNEGNPSEAWELALDEVPRLIEENEQLVRLRENVISQLGKTDERYWECSDEGCAWLSDRAVSNLCELCGEPRLA